MVAAQVFAGVDIDQAEPALLKRIDWAGLTGMALFLGCLEYVLDEGPRNDWFSDHLILLAAVVLVVAGTVFFWRSFTAKDPIVDLRVFADRNFATSSLMTFVVGMALYGMVYILPVFLGQVRGMNSSQIGSIMMIQGGAMFLAAPFVGAVLPRFDPRKTIFIGMMMGAIGVWMDASLTTQSDYDEFFWSQIIRGVGMMMCLVVMSQLAMATLPLSKIKSASGVYNLTRNIGGAIGLALINTLLDQRMALHLTSLASQITPDRPEVIDRMNGMVERLTGSMGDAAYGGMISQISREMHLQALTLSFNDLLRGLAILMAVMAFLVFTLKRPPVMRGGGGAH